MEVATISETGNEAMMPAKLAVRPTCNEVWKKNNATKIAEIQPIKPLRSADHFTQTSKINTAMTGTSVSSTLTETILPFYIIKINTCVPGQSAYQTSILLPG